MMDDGWWMMDDGWWVVDGEYVAFLISFTVFSEGSSSLYNWTNVQWECAWRVLSG